jgi:hypothetical protein
MAQTDWNQYVTTFDMDWASDFMIEETIDVLLQHRIKGTYFITHDFPALAKLQAHPDLFEIGIHPNFLPGSSHGTREREVLRELKNVAPFRDLTVEQTAPIVNRNTPGSGTLFKELCGFVAKQKLWTHTIAELGHAFRQN